ncbi:MAG: family 43 glycosylhydrolase, partial [Firmicutes bacterium]|nr:family 43 glycosylhydrolase [Candidatus Caballimonas caccae]
TKPQVKSTRNSTCEIFVIKVGDKNARWTDDWQWDTVTQLTRMGYKNMTEEMPTSDLNESAINEGPYVIYNPNNDKYYLTLSKGSYQNSSYAALQAIGDSPMGPFEKLSKADGGFLLQSNDNVTGPGHHSFITYGGKTYIVYHQQVKKEGNGDRAICVDEVKWIKNSKGVDIMYVNGPSRSPQAIFANSEYDNIANKATVTVVNGQEGTEKNLIDGLYGASTDMDFVNEFSATKKDCTITLTFNGYKTIRSIMIYNSKNYEKAFSSVNRIEFDFKLKNGTEGVAYIDNLKFNENYFYTENGEQKVLPCSASIAEFEEMYVNEIRIYFSDKIVNVSEIVVLGK